MDLVQTVRKSGSRGGVNFSWDEVANSAHRENYLGHSLKAPVGRWQSGRDLNWYAKAAEGEDDGNNAGTDETDAERQERLRKEELRKVKEAEEDAMARAMGLPPPKRDASGANAIEVGGKSRIGPASGPPVEEEGESSKTVRSRKHGDEKRRERRRHRSRSRSRDRERRRHRHEHDRRRGRSRDREDKHERRSRRNDKEGEDHESRQERRHRRDNDHESHGERRSRRDHDEGRDQEGRDRRGRDRERYRSRSRDSRRRSDDPLQR